MADLPSDLVPVASLDTREMPKDLVPLGPKKEAPVAEELRPSFETQFRNVARTVGPTAINFLDYPIRDLSARVVGAVKGGLPINAESRKRFYGEYEKSLPFAALPESETGKKISKVLAVPGQIIGGAATGLSNLLLGNEATEAIGPYAGAAADLLPYAGGKLAAARKSPAATMTAAEKAAAQLQNRAGASVSRAYETGSRGGGPTAVDVINSMQEARKEGQPFALTDVENPELRALAGAIYRQGGAARAVLDDFFKGRNVGQIDRVRELIGRHLSDESLRETATQLAAARSAHGRPLWDAAMEGGSLAPLEQQFTSAFQAIEKREAAATAELEAANKNLAAWGGNHKAAETSALSAQNALQSINAEKAEIHQRLVRAQADRTADAPGATWSPRLQELLDTPEIERGLRRGYAMERRFAVGEGRAFNPNEYAVIGTDAAGEPIVGQVPNMRLLAVAKEGLDAIIGDMQKDRRFGRPSKDELSYMRLRDGLISELDRLNPAYKEARDVWSGDTASMRALEEGRAALDAGRAARFKTPEDVSEHVNSLGPNDREFFIMGVADKLQERLRAAIDTTDKSRIIKNEETRSRLRPLFASEEEADQFLSAMEREHTMRQTSAKVAGGSQTAERLTDDRRAEGLLSGAHAIGQAAMGHWLPAIASALRTRRQFGGRPNPELSEAIAKMLSDPNINLEASGALVPPTPINRPPLINPTGAALFGDAAIPRH